MQPIAAFAVAELMMIDDNSILMLCCMVGATFYFIMLQLRAHAADAAVWPFCLRDGRDASTAAVAYTCCRYVELWVTMVKGSGLCVWFSGLRTS